EIPGLQPAPPPSRPRPARGARRRRLPPARLPCPILVKPSSAAAVNVVVVSAAAAGGGGGAAARGEEEEGSGWWSGPVVPPAASVHELLECPVCTNSMYPPIHQVFHI
ncbi:Os03g0297700, partial [Oryza sativa Japonica Group]